MESNLFFVTSTVVGWTDIFTREQYRNFLYESWDFCQKNDRFTLHAYVIMSNHIHFLASGAPETFGNYVGKMKQFVSTQIHKNLGDDLKESRRGWMMDRFQYQGRKSSKHDEFKLWKADKGREIYPLWAPKTIAQKFHYIHRNPVAMGWVEHPEEWLHSSARQYAGKSPTFPVEMIDILY